ncbi:hypothetical protein LLB_1284 [Legionella longbeachae D-4968]|nr:hypothetical protein LLB_1284 [Legionella longbeachae D-4968]
MVNFNTVTFHKSGRSIKTIVLLQTLPCGINSTDPLLAQRVTTLLYLRHLPKKQKVYKNNILATNLTLQNTLNRPPACAEGDARLYTRYLSQKADELLHMRHLPQKRKVYKNNILATNLTLQNTLNRPPACAEGDAHTHATFRKRLTSSYTCVTFRKSGRSIKRIVLLETSPCRITSTEPLLTRRETFLAKEADF